MIRKNCRQKIFTKFAFTFILILTPIEILHAVEMGMLASQEQTMGIVGISNEGSFSSCIGVVLDPTKVLTAATCTGDFNGAFAAQSYRVHPLRGSEIGGGLVIALDENVEPFVGVNQIILHPQNDFRLGAFNLAILDLAEPLTIPPVTIYGGDESVIGLQANSFGWRSFASTNFDLQETLGAEFLTILFRFFEANILAMPPILPANDDFDTLDNGGCFDSDVSGNTIFCAGFRNDSIFMESADQGGPLYFDSSQGPIVIGLLQQASGGFEIDGQFSLERFANVAAMRQFIENNAPNTQFVNNLDPAHPDLQPIIISPIIDLLLNEQ